MVVQIQKARGQDHRTVRGRGWVLGRSRTREEEVAEGGCSGGRERGRRKREPELDLVPRDEVDDAAQNDSDGGS
jgi:hypothetical protein